MADFEARTASSRVKVTDARAVGRLILEYEFPHELTVEVNEDGELSICGYAWFDADCWIQFEGDERMLENQGRHFLSDVCQFIPEGTFFVIDCIGAEKLRWPFSAMRIRVSLAGVSFDYLPGAAPWVSEVDRGIVTVNRGRPAILGMSADGSPTVQRQADHRDGITAQVCTEGQDGELA